MLCANNIMVLMQVALAAEQCDAEGMLIQSGAIDPDADKDLQAELDVEDPHNSMDMDEAAEAASAHVVATATAAVPAGINTASIAEAAGAAVPSTPPQESAEATGPPAGDVAAAAAAVDGAVESTAGGAQDTADDLKVCQ